MGRDDVLVLFVIFLLEKINVDVFFFEIYYMARGFLVKY